MTFQLEKTPWLPPAPADFSQRCKALAGAESGGALAASLASFALTANQCGSFARALKKARKCLVLDLDNTCWGGVIGDDGLDGIEVGQPTSLSALCISLRHSCSTASGGDSSRFFITGAGLGISFKSRLIFATGPAKNSQGQRRARRRVTMQQT